MMTAFFDTLRLIAMLLSAGALLAAAFCDVRSYQIPNRLPAIIALSFLAAAPGTGAASAVAAIATAGGVFAIGVVLFVQRCLGGGDVKLLAATALWVPPALFAPFTLVTAAVGAALGLVMLSPLRRWLPPAPEELLSSGVAGSLRQPMPFGVAIAAGGLFALAARLNA
ncbi:MAG TPA: prepilin peptidase [Stellaceae bacterium]|nr:prepilin peptidase [Stellaceae bacterium]